MTLIQSALWLFWLVPATAYRSDLPRHGSLFSIDLTLPPLQKSKKGATTRHQLTREIPVLYTNDPVSVSRWVNENAASNGCMMGFDVESVQKSMSSSPRLSVPAVVQLSTSQTSLVTHLTGPNAQSSLSLVEQVLRDPSIIKVGCGVDMDMVELHSKSSTVEGRSRFDLGHAFAKQQTPGLKTLVHDILGLDLPKDITICRSDWSQFPLSVEQIAYAAYDAWAGAAVADHLAAMQPETFGYSVLRESLRDQLSIQELHSRRVVRKRAKSILTALLEPHKEMNRLPGDSGLPQWKSRLVKELNVILKANKHQIDRPLVKLQDVQNLTFTY